MTIIYIFHSTCNLLTSFIDGALKKAASPTYATCVRAARGMYMTSLAFCVVVFFSVINRLTSTCNSYQSLDKTFWHSSYFLYEMSMNSQVIFFLPYFFSQPIDNHTAFDRNTFSDNTHDCDVMVSRFHDNVRTRTV